MVSETFLVSNVNLGLLKSLYIGCILLYQNTWQPSGVPQRSGFYNWNRHFWNLFFFPTFLFPVDKPGCNSGVASNSHPRLVSVPSRHCRLWHWPPPRWPFQMRFVHVTLWSGCVHWFSLGDCLWSSAKLLVLPQIPVPSYLYQPRLSSKTFCSFPPLPICSIKFCSSPNWWSIKFTCLEWALPVPDQFYVSIWVFGNGVMPMLIERVLPKRATFDLIAAQRRNTGLSF